MQTQTRETATQTATQGPQDADLLTVEQAAARLGLTPFGVYASCRLNRIPHCHIGSRVFIPRAALERWLDAKSQEALAVVQGVQQQK